MSTCTCNCHHTPKKQANPTALGIISFSISTFVLALLSLGIVTNNATVICGWGFFMGGLCQFSAGMWDFARGNSFGGCAFAIYGAFWFTTGINFLPIAGIEQSYTDGTYMKATGICTFAWVILNAMFSYSAWRTQPKTSFTTFFLLFISLIFLSIAQLFGVEFCYKVGGAVQIMAAVVGLYVSTVILSTPETIEVDTSEITDKV
ncbi:hypothetical protein K493DRAFT_318895 [Basidiobolus meristosporus CBS 931.73]|uniref:GPR1/FUN34/yaaH family protein n=1 Tax=Basidiobolus meristosporus CBS 931.73 TaxID=1314790 RepID=A0A1Y1XTV1_9FUNG|nr:hypothetical protein K493DRAFT_318895 [Basidiobolus meristosporus CBS 931.73]|eukprot:ORX89197.1 hypothetical protein K493DRAFT_318895 [Basidiobolus meristosporus CBS 931.73]